MGLKIIVVGAGIAGLTTALALRQAGHSIEIFEKSKFAKEVGAALGLTPNGSRVLATLGFSFERARAREVSSWDVVDGVALQTLKSMDFTTPRTQFGFPAYSVHRVDFHGELLHLAQKSGVAGEEPVTLHLASPVVSADAEEGLVVLEDGSHHYADLIIGADGIHSVLRPFVTGSTEKARFTDLSAFRFLIPTRKMRDDPALDGLMKWKGSGAATLANPTDPFPKRHMMWYDCQDGEVQNFVGISQARDASRENSGKPDFTAEMLEDFQAYHPDLKHVIKIAEDISCWPLMARDPLPSWTKGKIVLVGDAAHPMLPFGGQGSNQAIEDAGALGIVLAGVQSIIDVPARLKVFEDVRINRVSVIQVLSTTRAGTEKTVEEALKQYVPPGTKVPGSLAERNWDAYSHNVLQATAEALAAARLLPEPLSSHEDLYDLDQDQSLLLPTNKDFQNIQGIAPRAQSTV